MEIDFYLDSFFLFPNWFTFFPKGKMQIEYYGCRYYATINWLWFGVEIRLTKVVR